MNFVNFVPVYIAIAILIVALLISQGVQLFVKMVKFWFIWGHDNGWYWLWLIRMAITAIAVALVILKFR